MQEEIYQRIWELSPLVHKREAYERLTHCTAQLRDLYRDQGRLHDDPFQSVRHRKIKLPVNLIESKLQNSTCIVTGGLGCVGSRLVRELLNFNVHRIIILDIKEPANLTSSHDRLIYLHCDIRSAALVAEIFNTYKPDFVFHTAGQRDPGYAEHHVIETIDTNVIGTYNIVQACERTLGVRQCVFSSTGKASRYFTEEVYAASKKICEYLLDAYAKTSSVRYSIVRFTHILDNSIMNDQLRYASRHDPYIAVHCPAKYVTAQNVGEAVSLMLNALVFSEHHQCKFLIVKNLEWPVESLEVALYHLKESGRQIPIVFMGNPKGYTEKFFRGQLNWDKPDELNLLLNVYEHRFRTINEEDDIIISNIIPADQLLVEKIIQRLQSATDAAVVKSTLSDGLKRIVEDTLTRVHEADTINILRWGLQREFLNEQASSKEFSTTTSLLFNTLKNTVWWPEVSSLYDEVSEMDLSQDLKVRI